MRPIRVVLAIATLFVLLNATSLAAQPGPYGYRAGGYAGPGSIVAAFALAGPSGEGSATFVDNGAVVCEDADGDNTFEKGRGGVCIPFVNMGWVSPTEYRGDSILVVDATADTDVAYQVCVDMNGDGVCGGDLLAFNHWCRDVIYFSHSSFTGGFSNPMMVDHSNLWSQFSWCGGAGFPGYIVILCAGAHQTSGDPSGHTHEVTVGNVFTTGGGEWARGDYCGAPTAVKAYTIVR